MSSYGKLTIDKTAVSWPRNGVSSELLAAFQDGMLRTRDISLSEYLARDADDEVVEVIEYYAEPGEVAARLDAFGVNARTVLEMLERGLAEARSWLDDEDLEYADPQKRQRAEREHALMRSLDAVSWVERFRCGEDREVEPFEDPEHPEPGSRAWLLRQLQGWEERFALRLLLHAMPDAEAVTLNITELVRSGWITGEPVCLASEALAAMRSEAATRAPTVVLTEGRTDAEFLALALRILHPHLTDLVRFLDYEQRPEGGAGALARLVKSFAAAGIANNVVALFDNDAAAIDALRGMDRISLPANIHVLRYPDLTLAADYPTFGPPTVGHPEGSIAHADINGLAASIEIYLGSDVLAHPDGQLRNVHWRSYIAPAGRYQGEVTGKDEIHRAFRAKCAAALDDPRSVNSQDWAGMRAILDAVLSTFA